MVFYKGSWVEGFEEENRRYEVTFIQAAMVHSWSAECGHNPFVRRGREMVMRTNKSCKKGGHKAQLLYSLTTLFTAPYLSSEARRPILAVEVEEFGERLRLKCQASERDSSFYWLS